MSDEQKKSEEQAQSECNGGLSFLDGLKKIMPLVLKSKLTAYEKQQFLKAQQAEEAAKLSNFIIR